MTKRSLAFIACAFFASCQPAPPTELDPISLLVGSYDNSAQYAAADESLKITPKIGDRRPWIDLQHAVFRQVNVPSIEGNVIALEWRTGGPDGSISRQRLWAFRDLARTPKMDFYGLKNEADFSDAASLKALTLEDLISYGDACALPIMSLAEADMILLVGPDSDGVPEIPEGYGLSIPETCRITTQSGRDMILSATITILQDAIEYEESGRLADGSPIFEVPGQMAYRFERLD